MNDILRSARGFLHQYRYQCPCILAQQVSACIARSENTYRCPTVNWQWIIIWRCWWRTTSHWYKEAIGMQHRDANIGTHVWMILVDVLYKTNTKGTAIRSHQRAQGRLKQYESTRWQSTVAFLYFPQDRLLHPLYLDILSPLSVLHIL